MKRFKKIIPLILTIVSIFCLTACGFKPVDNNKNNNSTIYLQPINYTVNIETSKAELPVYNDLTKMLEEVRPAVVEVYAKLYNGTGCGSGTIIGDNGAKTLNDKEYYILTCHHVLDNGLEYAVKDIYGNKFTAYLVGGDPSSDVAVLKIKPSVDNLQDVKITTLSGRIRYSETSGNLVAIGEDVVAIGNPLGTLGGTVTKGIISMVDRTVEVEGKKMTLIQTDCAINSGNSGGALISTKTGEYVGMVNAGYSGSVEGLNFAIPSNISLDIAKQLIESNTGVNYGYVENRAYVNAIEVTNDNYTYLNFLPYDLYLVTNTVQSGWNVLQSVEVYGIETNSIFYKAGIELGDVLLEFKYSKNGELSKAYKIVTASDFLKYLLTVDFSVGDQVIFTVSKNSDNSQQTYAVTLDQYIYHDTTKFKQVGEDNSGEQT